MGVVPHLTQYDYDPNEDEPKGKDSGMGCLTLFLIGAIEGGLLILLFKYLIK